MSKRIFFLVLTAIIFSYSAAYALMPPMTPEELEQESDRVVIGKITKVECTGEYEDNNCVTQVGYKASLKVSKVLKGKKIDEIDLYFDDYNYKGGCVGSPDREHYEGDEGKYYLECSKKNKCFLTHWNGVVHSKTGTTALPVCTGMKKRKK